MDWYNRQRRYVHLELFSAIWHGFKSAICYTCKSAEANSLWTSRPIEWHCFGFRGVCESACLCACVCVKKPRKTPYSFYWTFYPCISYILFSHVFCWVSTFHLAHLASIRKLFVCQVAKARSTLNDVAMCLKILGPKNPGWSPRKGTRDIMRYVGRL